MLDIAYLVLLATVVWAATRWRRPWIRRLGDAGRRRLRLLAAVLTLGIAGLGGLVIAIQAPGEQTGIYRSSGYALGAVLLAGALVYASGLAVWHGRIAFLLRLSGWVLMTVALVVPSTLTLALPVVAALLATVANIPADAKQTQRPMADPYPNPS
jgi:hypothetical protein